MCSDGWYYPDEEIDGECPMCGSPTLAGAAQEGCFWSPVVCRKCEESPCDGSCHQ